MTASFIPDREAEVRHFHLFCGLGGGARGFNRGRARVGHLVARFRCIGGVDVDAASVADFRRLSGVSGTCLDLFDREQYRAFHGHEPPTCWRRGVADVEELHAWLPAAVAAATRPMRHPGNHRYAWALARRVELPATVTYPKRLEAA